MHLEVLVEDQSGKRMLDLIVPKIIDGAHTFRVHAYKGIGRIPKGLASKSDPAKRILLQELPRLLEGYGKAFASYPKGYAAHVAIVCDLDDRDMKKFLKDLDSTLSSCRTKPKTEFCLAIEEGEAWLLGDKQAVEKAYPKANKSVLSAYVYDSICGTWEVLANAIHTGGASALQRLGWQAVGHEKFKWADTITPHLNIERNGSPSLAHFVRRLETLGYTKPV
ncbi:hypothetical protein ACQR09_12245 [Bradyrhizobium oligotrophicum]|uniref:hypothetical protein n=1 Tax=Bradyrhizobium oligotrophicum TaxID=44255 RepID=UPI003EBBEB95